MSYKIVLRKSGQIQLLDEEGEKVVARPLLIDFLNENNLLDKEKSQNTRSLGKQIFDNLNEYKNQT